MSLNDRTLGHGSQIFDEVCPSNREMSALRDLVELLDQSDVLLAFLLIFSSLAIMLGGLVFYIV